MSVQRSLSIKSGVLTLAVLLCASLLVGCRKDEPAARKDTGFAARLKATHYINVSSEKNAALKELAINAAGAGDVEITKKAIITINVTEDRNSAAAKAAELLSKSGNVEAAIKVAELINMTELRNEVFKKIAAEKID